MIRKLLQEELAAIDKNTSETFDALSKESDRGVVLVSCSFLDNALEELLRLRFSAIHKKSKATINPLFETFGPLSSFSAKIKICYALDLIEKWIYDDLNSLRKIRNEFAHTSNIVSLSDKNIVKITKSLVGADNAAERFDKYDSKKSAPIDEREQLSAEQIANKERFRIILTVSFIGGMLRFRSKLLESDVPMNVKLFLTGKSPKET